MGLLIAVALLIIAPSGKIFCLKELGSKPLYDKYVGMVSFPLETVEVAEGRECALERLLVEEVGSSLCLSDPVLFGEVDMDFSTGKRSKIYCYAAFSPDEFIGNPSDPDVCFLGWLPFRELLEMGDGVRREVVPILNQFLES